MVGRARNGEAYRSEEEGHTNQDCAMTGSDRQTGVVCHLRT